MTFHDEISHTKELPPLVGVAPPAQDAPPAPPPESPPDTSAPLFASARAYWRDLERGRRRFTRSVRESAFAPTWLPERWRGPGWIYAFAAASVVCTVIVTGGLVLLFPDFGYRALPELLGVVVIALLFGAGPALFATVLSAFLINIVLQRPHFTLSYLSPAHVMDTTLYVAIGAAISLMASQVERQRQQVSSQAQQLEAVFDAMTDGVILYAADGSVTRANTAAREKNPHIARASYTAQPFNERVASFLIRDAHGHLLHPDQLPTWRVLRGEVLTAADQVDVTLDFGGPAETTLQVTGGPIRDVSGQVVSGVVVSRDVTQQRALERRTHASLDALLRMAEAMVSGPHASTRDVARHLADLGRQVLGCSRVSITAVQGEAGRATPIAIVGLAPDEEQRWWETQSTETNLADSPYPQVVARLQMGEGVVLDMSQAPYNEQPNPFHVATVLIAPMILSGRLVGLLSLDYDGLSHDFTADELDLAKGVATFAALVFERERLVDERAAAEARALALSAAKERMDDFLSIASHELRTPLTSVKGNVQGGARQLRRLLQSMSSEPATAAIVAKLEGVQKQLHRSDRSLVRLDRLITDLLDVSRLQTGKLELRLAPCDIGALAHETLDELRAMWPERDMRLVVDGGHRGADALVTSIDSGRIQQVMVNFISNALKYAPVERPITLRLTREPDNIRIAVHDEGPGLSPAQQARLFERFYRVEGISEQQGSAVGLGLGLYISKSIIEQHSGSVGVESTPGVGSTFWCTVPIR